jgi:hypothetical protein
MAKHATSMDIPTDAVTYRTDDPSHAIEAGEKYGIKMLSPETELTIRSRCPLHLTIGAARKGRRRTCDMEFPANIFAHFSKLVHALSQAPGQIW